MLPLDEIYNMYAITVHRFLLSKTHDVDLAEELTQETFYQAVKCIDKFDGSCKVSTWLCAIAKNQLQAYYRKHKEIPINISEIPVAIVPSAEENFFTGFNTAQIVSHIYKLKDPTREVLYLRLFGEFSFKEIGTIMGQTENWSRVTYYRGKEKVIKELRENE